ncbi:unnamed protein product, partial [Rotaria magnacalcarata]
MGASRSALLPLDEEKSICSETGFTPKQLRRLYVRFQELGKRNPACEFLTREELLDIREVALNPLGQRLVDVIIEDYGEANRINFKQFATVLAQFRRGKAITD